MYARVAVFHYKHVQGVPWKVAESAVIYECIQLLKKKQKLRWKEESLQFLI